MVQSTTLFEEEGGGKQQPYGLAGAEWPISIYDRPQLALSNLILRGNVDAATRSIFSPMTLTPTELKTMRQELLGPKPNFILKTIVDIGTNPLTWLGVIMTLRYPLGSMNLVKQLAENGVIAAKSVGSWASWLHTPMTNLRNMGETYTLLNGLKREITGFIAERLPALNDAYRVAISAGVGGAEQRKIVAMLKEWHLPDSLIQMTTPEVRAVTGRAAVLPGLEKQLSPAGTELFKVHRAFFDEIKGLFETNKDVIADLENKGIHIGAFLKRGYFPEMLTFNRVQGDAVMQMMNGGQKFSAIQDELIQNSVAPSLRKSIAAGIPNKAEFAKLLQESGGDMRLLGALDGYEQRLVKVSDSALRNASFAARRVTPVVGEEIEILRQKSFNKIFIDEMERGNLSLGAHLGSGNVQQQALRTLKNRLLAVEEGSPQFEKLVGDYAQTIGAPGQYPLQLERVTSRYLSGVASSHPWFIGGYRDKIRKALENAEAGIGTFEGRPADPWQINYVREEELPFLRGTKPDWQYRRNVNWMNERHKMLIWWRDNQIVDKFVPPGTKEWVMKHLGDTSNITFNALSNTISHYFYLSTLGFNISQGALNATQNFLTTLALPGVGITDLFKGYAEAGKRVSGMIGEMQKGVTFDVALKEWAPEYVKHFGSDVEKIAREMVMGGETTETALGQKAGRVLEKVEKVGLLPYSVTETSNRLSGFYTGWKIALEQGYTAEQASNVGAGFVNIAHFPGGPLGMPRVLARIPSALRQYMFFPLRYTGFLGASLRYGPDATKLYTGTLGKSLLVAMGGYYGAKNLLGVDISRGLPWGALPIPTYKESPFYPLPFVPPAIGVVGGVIQALAAGSSKPLSQISGLMLPGGVTGMRAYRSFAPKYADYENRTPDGRIPLYNDAHALVGSFTPFQLVLRGLGLHPVGPAEETGAAQWMLAQRDKIRAFRNDYMDALMTNDYDAADRVNRDFQRAYPELGPLTINKTDIKALHNRREVSRLDRISRGFPAEYRPLFQAAVSGASLQAITEPLQRQPFAFEQQNLQ